jgi:hypothetical protein
MCKVFEARPWGCRVKFIMAIGWGAAEESSVALIRLTITPAAYAVIVATHTANADLAQSRASIGEFYVWLEPKHVDRLRAVRKPGESYSDVILRMAEASEGGE